MHDDDGDDGGEARSLHGGVTFCMLMTRLSVSFSKQRGLTKVNPDE